MPLDPTEMPDDLSGLTPEIYARLAASFVMLAGYAAATHARCAETHDRATN
jgi:hypothetical protein